MNTVYQIDQSQLNELYDQLYHFELAFVKHASYQMFHLFGSPLHNYWQDENQAFGVYIVYYKLAKNYSRADFIHAIQDGKVPMKDSSPKMRKT